MPLTYSISNGIALAFVGYALIKVFTGKFSSISPAMWVVAVLSGINLAIYSFYIANTTSPVFGYSLSPTY